MPFIQNNEMEIRLSRRCRTEESENTVLDSAQNVLSAVENTIEETTQMMQNSLAIQARERRSASPQSLAAQSLWRQPSPQARAVPRMHADPHVAAPSRPKLQQLQPQSPAQALGEMSRRQPWIEPVNLTRGGLPAKQPAYILHDGGTSSESENEDLEENSQEVPSSGEDFETGSEIGFSDYAESVTENRDKVTAQNNFTSNTEVNSNALNDILEKEYGIIVPKMQTPPVSEKLAIAVSKWLRETPNREKIKELFNETAGQNPENVQGLQPGRINELLYQRLPFKAKVNDQKLRGMNSYFLRGVGLLVSLLDCLLHFEANTGLLVSLLDCLLHFEANTSTEGNELKLEDKKIWLNDCSLDIPNMRKAIHNCVHILSLGNAVCLQKRKSNLRPYLERKYHHLTQPSNPVTNDLLGSDLEGKISEFNRINEASRKLYARQKYRKQYRDYNINGWKRKNKCTGYRQEGMSRGGTFTYGKSYYRAERNYNYKPNKNNRGRSRGNSMHGQNRSNWFSQNTATKKTFKR